MNRPSDTDSISEAHNGAAFRWIDRALTALFLLTFVAVELKTALDLADLRNVSGLEALLLLLATAATITSVSRTLPFQNVFWGAIVIGSIGGTAHAISALASIPFGPFVYTAAAGPKIFGILPWTIPLMWILAIYTSRGVARLILQPWRKTRVYGFWLIGLTAALSLILDLGMDPFASRLNHYWIWEPTRFPYTWHGTPFTNFAGWIITALLIMTFVTPMLINKKPGSAPVEYRTAIVWVLLNLLFVTAALTHAFWTGAILVSAATVTTTIFAVRGARW